MTVLRAIEVMFQGEFLRNIFGDLLMLVLMMNFIYDDNDGFSCVVGRVSIVHVKCVMQVKEKPSNIYQKSRNYIIEW